MGPVTIPRLNLSVINSFSLHYCHIKINPLYILSELNKSYLKGNTNLILYSYELNLNVPEIPLKIRFFDNVIYQHFSFSGNRCHEYKTQNGNPGSLNLQLQ